MFVMGHTGLTLLAAYSVSYLINTLPQRQPEAEASDVSGRSILVTRSRAGSNTAQRLRIDYRVILLGSLLPDIIDKPLALWILPEVVNQSTRNFGHTLIFNIGLLAIGLVLLELIRSYRPLSLGLASLGHLLLDTMWHSPSVLLWPSSGWSFPPHYDRYEWFGFLALDRWLSFPELVGAMVLVWFVAQLYRQRSVLQFLRVGALE